MKKIDAERNSHVLSLYPFTPNTITHIFHIYYFIKTNEIMNNNNNL